MPETVKARKGMVVAWCRVSRITYQDHRPDTSSETWRLGLVAQASREGVIRKVTEFGCTAAEDIKGRRRLVTNPKTLDLAGLEEAYRQHRAEGLAFRHVEDVRAFVRPFLDSAHQVKSSPPTT